MFYQTILQTAQAEFKDRGSRFIAIANPISQKTDFKDFLNTIKKQHPKASHYCYAYTIGTPPNTITKTSDDGEPQSTAGKPILNQITTKNLNNLAIIVIRYFGGTLLGTQGLINAYKNAASMSLQVALIKQIPIYTTLTIECPTIHTNHILSLLKKNHCIISNNPITIFPKITAQVPLHQKQNLLTHLLLIPKPHINISWND